MSREILQILAKAAIIVNQLKSITNYFLQWSCLTNVCLFEHYCFLFHFYTCIVQVAFNISQLRPYLQAVWLVCLQPRETAARGCTFSLHLRRSVGSCKEAGATDVCWGSAIVDLGRCERARLPHNKSDLLLHAVSVERHG